MPILIGGVCTRKDAMAFLSSFPQFDIAMWGEGEGPLLQLAEVLDDNTKDLSKVSNIAYRDSIANIVFSRTTNHNYLDLSIEDVYPDYDDYFRQKKELGINLESILPIEGSRGCHWNRCKFCYLNTDYQYRLKSPDKICNEIKYMMDRHQIYSFEFLDNDFLGLDLKIANDLLDGLIKIKQEEPKFNIVTVEVITKGLDYHTIKKIFEAGIIYAQIGYESISNNLLKKINKKNTFASNLFYVKVSTESNVPLYSVNNIMNMPDETTEDIIEATNNLKFLRFFLHHLNFNHALVQLHVNSFSRYYPKIRNEKNIWELSEIAYFFLKDEIKEEYWWDIFSFMKKTEHFQWESFRQIERFYINNQHSYSIVREESAIKYSEFINNRKIVELDFDENSIEFLILNNCNKSIVSLNDIMGVLNVQSIDRKEVIGIIDDLYHKGLVYKTTDYDEIVSVINI